MKKLFALLVLLSCALAQFPPALRPGDWNKLTPSGGPAPVAYAAGVVVGERFIYTFGGYRESQEASLPNIWYNSVFRYDVYFNQWAQMFPLGTSPGARGYTIYFLRGDEMIIGFGGSFTWDFVFTSIYNDLWGYNFITNTWRQINAGGSSASVPSPRVGPAATYNPATDRITLFGGVNAYFEMYDDTWEYDFYTNTWTQISTTVNPSARYDMLAVRDPNLDVMIIYGGETISDTGAFVVPPDVMWEYNYHSKTWTQINANPPMTPPRNNGCGAIFYNQMMVLTGGDIGGGPVCPQLEFAQNNQNQTWSFNADTNAFTELCPRNVIVNLKRATTVLVANVMYVFGGWSFYDATCTGPVFNFDVWAFPLLPLPPGGPACGEHGF